MVKENNSFQKAVSLYLHIPFCRQRCSYCDFNTYTTVGGLRDAYINALIREMHILSEGRELSAKTVYIGGGTPSLIPAKGIGELIGAIRRCFSLPVDPEISMEINPESITRTYLEQIRDVGINRLSIGVQSAMAEELQLLGREHDYETAVRAFRYAREAGFNNINLDLIYGLPDQSTANWEKSLQAAVNLDPDHLSLYCLTIESGTPMHRWLNNGAITAPDPDIAAEQFAIANDYLMENSYDHYEISNWARPAKQCRHNISYWRNDEYLGFGAGAHGHAAGFRYSVVKQPRVYIRRMDERMSDQTYPFTPATISRKNLTTSDMMSDTLITQLRLLEEGLDIVSFEEKFGLSPQAAYPGVIETLRDWDLLRLQGQRLLLTERGWFLSNQVFYRFM